MTWTTDLPTETGYYWFCNEVDEKEVVYVDVVSGRVAFFGGTTLPLKVHATHAKPLWQHIPTPPDE